MSMSHKSISWKVKRILFFFSHLKEIISGQLSFFYFSFSSPAIEWCLEVPQWRNPPPPHFGIIIYFHLFLISTPLFSINAINNQRNWWRQYIFYHSFRLTDCKFDLPSVVVVVVEIFPMGVVVQKHSLMGKNICVLVEIVNKV